MTTSPKYPFQPRSPRLLPNDREGTQELSHVYVFYTLSESHVTWVERLWCSLALDTDIKPAPRWLLDFQQKWRRKRFIKHFLHWKLQCDCGRCFPHTGPQFHGGASSWMKNRIKGEKRSKKRGTVIWGVSIATTCWVWVVDFPSRAEINWS